LALLADRITAAKVDHFDQGDVERSKLGQARDSSVTTFADVYVARSAPRGAATPDQE
jgi:hypothetical protein